MGAEYMAGLPGYGSAGQALAMKDGVPKWVSTIETPSLTLAPSSGDLTLNPAGNVVITEAKNIVLGTTTGTKIGTGTTQKLGFWNAAPVVQPAHIVDADGTLADATTKINLILADLATTGLQAAA